MPLELGLGRATHVFQAVSHHFPIDVSEECIDVLGSGCPVIHLVGVLEHVHGQQGKGRRGTVGVVCQPVVFHSVAVDVPTQQDPPGATSQPGSDATEFGLPIVEAPEGLRDRLALLRPGLSVSAQVSEVGLVVRYRSCADQVLPLQIVVDVRRQVLVGTGFGELL